MRRRRFIRLTVAGGVVGVSGCLGDSYDEEMWTNTVRPWVEDAIPFVETSQLRIASFVQDEENYDEDTFEEMNTEAENLQARRDAMPSPISEFGDPNMEDWTIMMSRGGGEEEWRVEGEDLVRILGDTGELAWVVDGHSSQYRRHLRSRRKTRRTNGGHTFYVRHGRLLRGRASSGRFCT